MNWCAWCRFGFLPLPLLLLLPLLAVAALRNVEQSLRKSLFGETRQARLAVPVDGNLCFLVDEARLEQSSNSLSLLGYITIPEDRVVVAQYVR